jgi:hypothetical protein
MLPHDWQQLESQEPAADKAAGDAPKVIKWTNKPQAPHACLNKIEGAGEV